MMDHRAARKIVNLLLALIMAAFVVFLTLIAMFGP